MKNFVSFLHTLTYSPTLQALKKLAQFLQNNVLPGAALEIGLLCSFAVFTNSAEAISQLLVPIMNSLVASLGDFPTTGFGGDDDSRIDSSRVQVCRVIFIALSFKSPDLEMRRLFLLMELVV